MNGGFLSLTSVRLASSPRHFDQSDFSWCDDTEMDGWFLVSGHSSSAKSSSPVVVVLFDLQHGCVVSQF